MRLSDIDTIRKGPGYARAVREALRLHGVYGWGMGVWVQAIDDGPRTIHVRPTHPNDLGRPWGPPFAALTLFELPRIPPGAGPGDLED